MINHTVLRKNRISVDFGGLNPLLTSAVLPACRAMTDTVNHLTEPLNQLLM